jgi:hypothetical protein
MSRGVSGDHRAPVWHDVLCAREPIPVEQLPEEGISLGISGARDIDLWQAVAGLTEKQRQAAAYHYVAGLLYAEIRVPLTRSRLRAKTGGDSAPDLESRRTVPGRCPVGTAQARRTPAALRTRAALLWEPLLDWTCVTHWTRPVQHARQLRRKSSRQSKSATAGAPIEPPLPTSTGTSTSGLTRTTDDI